MRLVSDRWICQVFSFPCNKCKFCIQSSRFPNKSKDVHSTTENTGVVVAALFRGYEVRVLRNTKVGKLVEGNSRRGDLGRETPTGGVLPGAHVNSSLSLHFSKFTEAKGWTEFAVFVLVLGSSVQPSALVFFRIYEGRETRKCVCNRTEEMVGTVRLTLSFGASIWLLMVFTPMSKNSRYITLE